MEFRDLAKEANLTPEEFSEDNELVAYITNCIQASENYRNQFTQGWQLIEEQLRCVHPSDWSLKEKWQTKVFLPLQSKTSEVVKSYLNKMIFGTDRNFDIAGSGEAEREQDDYLMELIDAIKSKGGFNVQKDFALQEAIDIGTSFLKILVNQDGNGVNFTWRSPYNCLIDPQAKHDFYLSKYWIDEYTKDLGDLVNEASKPNSLYDKDAVQRLLASGEVKSNPTEEINQSGINLETIRTIDGTGNITVPKEFTKVAIHEYWGVVKVKKTFRDEASNADVEYYEYEQRVVTIANKRAVLRNDKNDFGFIPVVIARTKKRKYDTYGRGYFENVTDLQELMNSMVCLGFDSLKISSMDIAIIDESKIADETSIQYKPLAIWKMKDVNGAKITRSGMSALRDILQGVAMLDGMHQDATGATRQAQGTQSVPGTSGGGEETLGAYQSKLQMVDNRFLDQAYAIEIDFILPLIRYLFKIIVNPKIFDQEKIDKLLGKKQNKIAILDPKTSEPVGFKIEEESKLSLEELRSKIDLDMKFRITGVTHFMEKMSLLQKLDGLLTKAVTNPLYAQVINLPKMFKRFMQMSEIPEWQDLVNPIDDATATGLAQQNIANQAGSQRPTAEQGVMDSSGMPQTMRSETRGG